jgi:oligopeptide transport system substrate-binding protein
MQKRRLFYMLLCCLLVVAILAAGCTTGKKPVSNHIRYALSAEPETIDPRMSTSLSASAVEAQLFEGLTTLDANNRPVSAAAERWDVSPDGRKITFILRAGIKWSNGEPVNMPGKPVLVRSWPVPTPICCIA